MAGARALSRVLVEASLHSHVKHTSALAGPAGGCVFCRSSAAGSRIARVADPRCRSRASASACRFGLFRARGRVVKNRDTGVREVTMVYGCSSMCHVASHVPRRLSSEGSQVRRAGSLGDAACPRSRLALRRRGRRRVVCLRGLRCAAHSGIPDPATQTLHAATARRSRHPRRAPGCLPPRLGAAAA